MTDHQHPDSVWMYYSTKAETVAETSQVIFRHILPYEEYAKLIDARTGEIVRICTSNFEYAPGFFLPMIRVRLLRAIRIASWTGSAKVEYAITHDGRKPQLLLLNFRVPQEAQKKGLATQMLAAQVEAARAFGFTLIHAYAAGGSGSEAWDTRNGYYTAPRLGFEARLSAADKARLPPEFRHLTFLSEILAQPGGRSWWQRHGFALEVAFDTSPHSRSMQRLHTALAGLQRKRGYWMSDPEVPLRVERGPSMYPPSHWRQRAWSYRIVKQAPIKHSGSRGEEIQGWKTEVSSPCT